MFRTLMQTLWSRKRRLLSTSTAVVAGVAFMVATLVVGDTVARGFDTSFTEATAGTDFVVRSDTRIGGAETRVTGTVDEAVIDDIATIDGVAAAAPSIEGTVQIVGADGEPLGGEGPPTLGRNWVADPELNEFTLLAGRPPVADDEIVIDANSLSDGDLAIGDEVTVLTPDPHQLTIVGTVEESVGGTTWSLFDLDTAQNLIGTASDEVSSILVRVDPAADIDAVGAAIGAELPGGLEMLTNAELNAELRADIDASFLSLFETMLLVFAGIAIVVAIFSINNTFAILVAQRTRESALLRAVGGSRRQVLGGVAAEAAAVGVIATAIGFAIGTALATGLHALMTSALDMPDASLQIEPRAIIAALVVGIGVTMLSAVGPGLRASRVAPIAALREAAVDEAGTSRRRGVIGLVLGAASTVALFGAPAFGDPLPIAGLGALGLLVAVVVAGPAAARPAAAVIGALPASVRGLAGRLARRNAMRNPRRTSTTASALLVGTAVVAGFTTIGASIKATLDDTIDSQFAGDLVTMPDGFDGVGLSAELPGELSEVDGVSSVVGAVFSPAIVNGDETEVIGGDAADLDAIMDLGLWSGDFDTFTDGDVAVSRQYADDHGLRLGSALPIAWVDGVSERPTVAAIYENRLTWGDVIVPLETVDEHVADLTYGVILIDVADDANLEVVKQSAREVADRYVVADVLDRDEYSDQVGAEIDQLLFIIYGLLGVAIVIALVSIGNTLSLSIHDRRHEIGVLRAVGQTRSQVRSAVRWEAVIVTVFGAAGGIGLGLLSAWGFVRALNESEGFGVVAVPGGQLAIVGVLAAVAGVLAAVRPARRAARTDILAAIGSE